MAFWILVAITIVLVVALMLYDGRHSATVKVKGGKGSTANDNVARTNTMVSFALGLLATFLGVLLAFNLTNYQAEKDERQNLVSLLDQSVTELNLEIVRLKDLPAYIKDRTSEDSLKMINNNPLADVVSISYLTSNPLFPKYCSQMGAMAILTLARDKEKMRQAVNNPDFALENRLVYIDEYRKYIEDLRDVLVLERDHVRGNISALKVAEGMKALSHFNTEAVPWRPGQTPWMPR